MLPVGLGVELAPGHGAHPVGSQQGQGVYPVVFGEAPPVSSDVGELIEQGVPNGLAQDLQVSFDDSRVQDDAVLVKQRFQGVDDALLFLDDRPHLFDGAAPRIILGQNRFEQFDEHAVSEVALDDDLLDLPVPRNASQKLQVGLDVPAP